MVTMIHSIMEYMINWGLSLAVKRHRREECGNEWRQQHECWPHSRYYQRYRGKHRYPPEWKFNPEGKGSHNLVGLTNLLSHVTNLQAHVEVE